MRKSYFAVVLTASALCLNVGTEHIEVKPKPAQVIVKSNFFADAIEKTKKQKLIDSRKPENLKAYTLSAMKNYGWGQSQYSCLYSLWKKESNWRWNAKNKWSTAYGIPQATPGWKMRHAGADWKTNPFTQIKWGLSYIKRNHGTPCIAWKHSEVNNWY